MVKLREKGLGDLTLDQVLILDDTVEETFD